MTAPALITEAERVVDDDGDEIVRIVQDMLADVRKQIAVKEIERETLQAVMRLAGVVIGERVE